MKTIDLQEFTNNFMEISKNLTHAELKLLYLYITEPDVIKLSQQKFAEKIGKHRRTINIGLKKLVKHGYISDINITDDSDKNITKNQIEQGDIINDETKDLIKSPKLAFDELHDAFIVFQKHNVLIKLLEKYPDRYSEILSGIRNCLPRDINRLAKKYGFVEELRIIKISNEKIKELKKNPSQHEYWDMNKVVGKYIDSYNGNRKNIAMKYVRQALIYFPFIFDKFLIKISAYKYSDLDELVKTMKKEIYNTDKL